MSLDHVLLGLLRQPASGYDLKTVFDNQIHFFWAAELSQIYPALGRLEDKGWLKSRSAGSKRGPARRVYETTPAGRRALREWLETPPELGSERNASLAQLCFMGELADFRKTERFFLRLRDQILGRLQALERIERGWGEADPRLPDSLPNGDFHVYLALRKGLHSLRALVEWCDEALKQVRTRIAREEAEDVKPRRSPKKKT